MRRIAIMQGRLVPPEDGRFQSFPREHWRSEFALAAEAGLDAIEWIYDAYGADVNPIATDAGIAELEELRRVSGVAVVSICADYFMDFPIIRAERPERSDALDRLRWLLERARRAAVGRIVLPFVDASRIVNKKDAQIAEEVLRAALPAAEAANVELHLETDLGPQAFAGFLNSVEHGFIKVNYDSGNSASLGYDALKEFAAYGPRIGSVHIKDRRLGGGTVELGTGSANLPAVFQGLHKVGYAGDFVLQAARGEPGAEVVLAARHRRYVKTAIAAAAGEPQTSTH